MKTPERLELAHELIGDGKNVREAAEILGVARSTLATWLDDPDGVKTRARKTRYAQPCMDCGVPTSGSEGWRDEPRCLACARAHRDDKIWTQDAIVLAIQEWIAEYGDPPSVNDWGPYRARHALGDEERAARFEQADGAWPSVTTVYATFGSFNAALVAAGLNPRAAHGGGGNERRRRPARAKAAA